MSKVLYLIILWILWFREWEVLPLGAISRDIHMGVTLCFMLFGCYHYKDEADYIWGWSCLKPFLLIILGVFLSMIAADFTYGQSMIQSFISYRYQLYWMIIPFLFYIKPSAKEIIQSFSFIFGISVVIYAIRLLRPEMFLFDYKTFEQISHADYEITVPGYWVAVPLLFWNLMKLRFDFNIKTFLFVIFIWIFIFLMGNRSTLFPVTLFLVATLITIRSKNKPVILLFLFLMMVMVVFETQDIWMGMIDETANQVDNSDYNRNKAYAYFLSESANPSWLNYIFGNGFLSAHSSSLMETKMSDGIFQSDVGFVGFWNQFGVIPIFSFLYILGYAVFNRNMGAYLRCWAIQFLFCSATISYFANSEQTLNFAFFYYLLYNNRLSDEFAFLDDYDNNYQL